MVRIDAAAELESPLGPIHDRPGDGDLDAGIGQTADVRGLAGEKAVGGHLPHREEGVGRQPVIPGELKGQAAAKQRGIEAQLRLTGALGTDVGVADVPGQEAGLVVRSARRPSLDGVERPGRPPGPAEGAAHLHLPEGLGPEGLLGDDVRPAHFGVNLQAQRFPKGAIAVEPQAAGEKVAVPQLEEVLEEEPGVDDAQAVLAREERGGVGDDGVAGTGEALAERGGADLVRGDALTAERERRPDLPRQPEIDVPHVVRRQDRVANLFVGQPAFRLADEGERTEVAVFLLGHVVADREAVGEPGDRGVGDRATRAEPLHSGRETLVEQRVDHPRVTR